jgi:methionyl aminopeptidase
VSINNEVVHAVPREDRLLQEGDIVSVDCGVEYKGHFTDACRTYLLPKADVRTRKLVKVTKDALERGIAAATAGAHVGDISFAIQRHVERHRFNVSLDYTGHGIGLVLHGDPQIPNYGPPGMGAKLRTGTCLAIEPVVFDGATTVKLQQDGWTVCSHEGNLSAHFEDTVIITEEGPEIITRSP